METRIAKVVTKVNIHQQTSDFAYWQTRRIKVVWPRWKKSGKSIIAGGTVLNQDFREFVQLLNDNQVHYLVVAAGIQRARHDHGHRHL